MAEVSVMVLKVLVPGTSSQLCPELKHTFSALYLTEMLGRRPSNLCINEPLPENADAGSSLRISLLE